MRKDVLMGLLFLGWSISTVVIINTAPIGVDGLRILNTILTVIFMQQASVRFVNWVFRDYFRIDVDSAKNPEEVHDDD